MSFFLSSFFDASNTATAMNVIPADAAEAPAKDGSKEKAADETAGADGLFDAQRTENVE